MRWRRPRTTMYAATRSGLNRWSVMSATKLDFRCELRELYAAGRTPSLVDVPELAFLMVDGRGDPGTGPEFRAAIEALYAIAYPIKFTLKREPDGIDYRVMPLEGLFWVEGSFEFPPRDPSAWSWTAMIMQPGPVNAEMFESARHSAAMKESHPALDLVRFERFHEGSAAQVMHVGPYAEEQPTIACLHQFIAEHGYRPRDKHHEIYLSDPNRSAPERLKTVIRQPIATIRHRS
jgi:hypothetical protein